METATEFHRVRALLDEAHIEPKRAFGQNFLIDSDAIETIVSAFDVGSYDKVIEIGPGLGALTLPLAKKAKDLLAIDADRDMAAILSKIVSDKPNVTVINVPFEHWEPKDLPAKLLLIGNLPYNLTTRLLECCLAIHASDLGFMVQKEVADKLDYVTGEKDCNALSCFLAMVGTVKQIAFVPRGCFYPIPKVDSAFVSLHIERKVPFEAYVGLKRLFLTPNKTLQNALRQTFSDPVKLTELGQKYAALMEKRTRQLTPNTLLPLALDVAEALKK